MKTSNESVSLFTLQGKLLEDGLPFVSYRLPGETEPVTLLTTSPLEELERATDVKTDAPGFLLAPFNPSKPRVWMTADLAIKGTSITVDLTGHIQTKGIEAGNSIPESTSIENYKDQHEIILQTIKSGKVKKAVLSRTIMVELDSATSAPLLFNNLMHAHPSAFVYLLSFPDYGTWLGATPELLVNARVGDGNQAPGNGTGDGNQSPGNGSEDKIVANMNGSPFYTVIETMALAGTRATGTEGDWGAKEIDEHDWVRRFVRQKLEEAGCVNIGESQTYTSPAGNVEHMRTDFSAMIRGDNTLALVNKLHPTPAVCGWPAQEALEVILETEQHDREYYSGYLGPVNVKGSTSLFVNLRCLKLGGTSAALFVGGGITASSKADDEWNETTIKSRTLLAEIEKIRNLASSTGKSTNE